MPDVKSIADKADIIINGYAFTRKDESIQVLNLNSPNKAVVFSTDGVVLETTILYNAYQYPLFNSKNSGGRNRRNESR